MLLSELDTAARDRYLATKYRGPGQLGAGARRKADNGSDMESGYSSHRESKDTSEFWCSVSESEDQLCNLYCDQVRPPPCTAWRGSPTSTPTPRTRRRGRGCGSSASPGSCQPASCRWVQPTHASHDGT